MRNKTDWECTFGNLKHSDQNFYISEKKYDVDRSPALNDNFKKGVEIPKVKLFCL